MCKLTISLLEMNYRNLEKDIKCAEEAGIDGIHIDIMDGNFVPGLGISPRMIKSIRGVTKLEFDVHVMAHEAGRFVDAIVDAGADIVTVHYEACSDLKHTLQKIKNRGVKCGIAINPDTETDALNDLIKELDIVHIMTTYPGREGQKFLVDSLNRISQLRRKIDAIDAAAEIEVDGNVTLDNAEQVIKAGAAVVVSGRALTQGDMSENIKRMKEKMQLAEKR